MLTPVGNRVRSVSLVNPAVGSPKKRVLGRPFRATATTSPELTVYLVDKMNKELELDLVKPRFIGADGTQTGLFD